MKKFSFLFLLLFIFSCASRVTEQQREQYEACKKQLLEKKELLTAMALNQTKGKQDSLRDYFSDIENNSLDQLVGKYDVAEEDINAFVFSVCATADRANAAPSAEELIKETTRLSLQLDSVTKANEKAGKK